MSFDDFTPFEGPEKVVRPNRRSSTGSPRFFRKKSTDRVFDKPVDLENEKVPGRHDHRCLQESLTAPFRNTAGFPCYRKNGTLCGMTKVQADEHWTKVKEQARKDVEKILSKFPTDDDFAQEALQGVVEIARGTASARDRLTAWTTILKFCKATPTSKQDITINTAEAWLNSLDDDSVTVEVIESKPDTK